MPPRPCPPPLAGLQRRVFQKSAQKAPFHTGGWVSAWVGGVAAAVLVMVLLVVAV